MRDIIFLDCFAEMCVGEGWGDMTENPTSSSAWENLAWNFSLGKS